MADFISRLGERTAGTSPVVRPLIDSVFASEQPARWTESELEGEPAPSSDDPHEILYHRTSETPRVSEAPRLVPDDMATTRDEEHPANVTLPSEVRDEVLLASQAPTVPGSSTRGLTSRREDRDATPDIPGPRHRVRSPEEPGPLDTRSESGHEAQNVSSTVPETGPGLSRSGESEREAAPERRPQNTSRAVADGPILPTEHRLQTPHRVEPGPAPRHVEKVPQRLVPEGSPLDMFAAEGDTSRAMLRLSTAFVERDRDTTAAPTPPSGTEDPLTYDENTPGSDIALVHRAAPPVAPVVVPRTIRHQPDQRQKREPEPPAPIIRVAIGRIEVRAITPPPARRETPTRPGPLLSLDDYLKQRNEGQ